MAYKTMEETWVTWAIGYKSSQSVLQSAGHSLAHTHSMNKTINSYIIVCGPSYLLIHFSQSFMCARQFSLNTLDS